MNRPAGGWAINIGNQTRTTEEAYAGSYSWKIPSTDVCGPCRHINYINLYPEDLNLDDTYRFSAWVKAPAGHDQPAIRVKYKTNGQWQYPSTAYTEYTGSGEWQKLSVELDLSQYSNVDWVQPMILHRGPSGTAAYFDEVEFMNTEPGTREFDVEVATDAGFTNVIHSESGLPNTDPRSVMVGNLQAETQYHWRVRGMQGPWTARTFRTAVRPGHVSGVQGERTSATDATLSWGGAYPLVRGETFEGDGTWNWSRDLPNQRVTSRTAYAGKQSYRINSSTGCTPKCQYLMYERLHSDELDLQATYRFSAWVKAPEGHDAIKLQIKYHDGGGWVYPNSAVQSYTQSGMWQHLSVELDLSQVSNLAYMEGIITNAGPNVTPAYIDNIEFSRASPFITQVDLQVARDEAFTDLVRNEAGRTAPYALTNLSGSTAYFWLVRARNSAGAGPWSEGEVLNRTDLAARRYYVKDHLGTPRSIVDPDRAGAEADKVVEARDHYPYGLRMPRRVLTTGTETDEDYTGHELDAETGMHYAGARYYMSALGRWNGTDPLADKNFKDSPYTYVVNNPLLFIDPTGRDTTAETDSGDEVTIQGEGSGLPQSPTGIVVTASPTEDEDSNDSENNNDENTDIIPFSFMQPAGIFLEGVPPAAATYNIRGYVILEQISGCQATLNVLATGQTEMTRAGSVNFHGNVHGVTTSARTGERRAFDVPFSTPKGAYIHSSGRVMVGQARVQVQASSSTNLNVTVGYRVQVPDGSNNAPTPPVSTEEVQLPTLTCEQ